MNGSFSLPRELFKHILFLGVIACSLMYLPRVNEGPADFIGCASVVFLFLSGILWTGSEATFHQQSGWRFVSAISFLMGVCMVFLLMAVISTSPYVLSIPNDNFFDFLWDDEIRPMIEIMLYCTLLITAIYSGRGVGKMFFRYMHRRNRESERAW